MKKRKPQPKYLNPVERALITRDWKADVSLARIAAIISDSSDNMVHRAGTVFFVVLGAAIASSMDPEDLRLRIIRGATNAVYEQAGEPVITSARRTSISRGLEVAAELVPNFTYVQLVKSACDLALKLKTGHAYVSDFEAILQGKAAHNECVVAV